MILFIVTDTYERYLGDPGWFWTRNTLERSAGDACLMLHYTQLGMDMLERLRPWAICHSGGSTDYDRYDVLQDEIYRNIVQEAIPAQIGFCGGHQILASFFGSSLGAIRTLRPDEPDLHPYSPRHRSKPVYGTQFHPEQSHEPYLDGEIILNNFFRIARAHAGMI